MTVAGLLLVAGAGRRMGGPKGLLRDADGVPFVDRAVGALLDGGADVVTVVVGAAAEEVTALLQTAGWVTDRDVAVTVDGAIDGAIDVVVADDWAQGMGASLRAGLTHLLAGPHACALVNLVDLPDVSDVVVRRVLASAASAEPGRSLARATYHGRPGHPVLLGRQHWAGVVESVTGDRGARDYLAAHACLDVECGDLATGRDVDRPTDL